MPAASQPVAGQRLGVAIVGFGWMGHVHARAYTRAGQHFPELGVTPDLAVVADPDAGRRAEAKAGYGVPATTAEWRDLLEADGIQAVSITAPNALHREIAVELARAGKHLWIEKPVGLSAADAVAVAQAAAQAGVRTAVGFNYRNAPAVEHARALLADGAIGPVTHARFRLLSDYAAHPDGARTWRFERDQGGSGVIGDLASHGVDLITHLLGDVDELVADSTIIIGQRPRAHGAASHFAHGTGELAPVENEDYVSALLRLTSGARVTLEASRVSVSQQNAYGFEIHGTKGALSWDFRRMGELGVSVGDRYQDQMTSTVLVGPGHGEFGAFQPGAGIPMGYDDLKVIEAARFLQSIVDGEPRGATVADAVRTACVLECLVQSARTRAWVTVPR
jgi:predicted dehydrogenase